MVRPGLEPGLSAFFKLKAEISELRILVAFKQAFKRPAFVIEATPALKNPAGIPN